MATAIPMRDEGWVGLLAGSIGASPLAVRLLISLLMCKQHSFKFNDLLKEL